MERARGVRPRALARASLMITVAAAPSLMGELLPAVTVPLAWKAGFSLARTSREVSARGSSSVSKRKVCVVGIGDPPLSPTARDAPAPAAEAALPFPFGSEV